MEFRLHSKQFRLKAIQIYGFKSFADKSTLEFHEGITAIVGPNGCGKSNIADAFRWVMGEQSAKSMRGNKMPDVIFAGTSHRKPLNFSEVTLTFSNADISLPVDYEEVAITRRLHRSGESDYFLNRQPVRLKDVQDLLLDSGIGRHAFAIFEQGKIDQVIQYTPLERRFIFEEAAGILRFLQRKKEALRKLEQLDQNLLRVQDIHHELKKQIHVLEEQATQAKQYKEQKDSLENLEKGLFIARSASFEQKRKELLEKENGCKQSIDEHQKKLVEWHLLYAEEQKKLKDEENILKAKQEELFQARSQKELYLKEKQHAHEQIEQSLSKEKKLRSEVEALLEKRFLSKQEMASIKQKLKPQEGSLKELEQTFKKQKEDFHILENELQILRDQRQSLSQKKLHGVETANQAEGLNQQYRFRLDANKEKKEHLKQRHQNLIQWKEELHQEVEKKKELYQTVSKQIELQKQLFQQKELDYQKVCQTLDTTLDEQEVFLQSLAHLKARQHALNEMQKSHEGFSDGSKKILQQASLPESPLYQIVSELYHFFTPKEKGLKFFSQVMRPYAQTLATLTWEHFFTVIQYAEQHNITDYSLVCLENLNEPIHNEASTKSLLHFMEQGKYNHHFLHHVGLGETLEKALQLPHSIWLFEKGFLDLKQVFFSGNFSDNSTFSREAELKSLVKRLEDAETKRLFLEENVKVLRAQKNHVQNERVHIDQQIRLQEIKLVEANFALQKVKSETEKAEIELTQISQEIQMLDASLKEIEEVLQKSELKQKTAIEHLQLLQQDESLIESDLKQKIEAWKKGQEKLKEEEFLFEEALNQTQKLTHALNLLEVKDQEGEKQQLRLEEELELSHIYREKLQNKQSHQTVDVAGIEKTLQLKAKELQDAEDKLQSIKQQLENILNQANDKQNHLKEIEKTLYQYGVQIAQCETALQAIVSQLEEKYHLSLDELKGQNITLEKSVDVTEKQVRALRQLLENAGNVNFASIDECEKLKERNAFLNTQVDDLAISKKDLLQIISDLDTQSRVIFKETFLKIKENFKKNFQVLFVGGEADLELTDAEDILEAGIEISAKPPGKQMRSISLLSGGEKCLTAMALLFAIFEVKPSPFCILDEIDAPLDDSNVERFLNVVRQFIDRCQFIIITHNKRTMAIADRIYGVSMEERGVSKLLCMEFQQDTAKVELQEAR